MKILDLSPFEVFRDDKKAKVLRHSSSQDLWALHREGRFPRYQNGQSWEIFSDAKHVVSFIAERHKYAKFAGVWSVKGVKVRPDGRVRYRTKEVPGFEDLVGRLVVDWGDGARSWAQWLHRAGNKNVNEILPANYVMDFPGFYDFVLSYDELAEMIGHPDANREWHRMLSSISGVYLILDTKSGKQYVGSAYGRGGIWGRWCSYAKTPSGGNKLLKELLQNKPRRHHALQFSILRVLEPSATREETIGQETLAKVKLGSRAFGLNEN